MDSSKHREEINQLLAALTIKDVREFRRSREVLVAEAVTTGLCEPFAIQIRIQLRDDETRVYIHAPRLSLLFSMLFDCISQRQAVPAEVRARLQVAEQKWLDARRRRPELQEAIDSMMRELPLEQIEEFDPGADVYAAHATLAGVSPTTTVRIRVMVCCDGVRVMFSTRGGIDFVAQAPFETEAHRQAAAGVFLQSLRRCMN